MKLLKIENQEGYYLKKDEYKKVDTITKEDILALFKIIYEEEAVEFDVIGEDNNRPTIPSPSQSLIYEKLYEKLAELRDKKKEIIRSVSAEFREAEEKYVQRKLLECKRKSPNTCQ